MECDGNDAAGMDDTPWSAPTCRRFAPGDLSPGEGAFSARCPARGPHLVEIDGDKSPHESGDKSPHSKEERAASLWSAPAERSDDGALAAGQLVAARAKAVSRYACHRTPRLPAASRELEPIQQTPRSTGNLLRGRSERLPIDAAAWHAGASDR